MPAQYRPNRIELKALHRCNALLSRGFGAFEAAGRVGFKDAAQLVPNLAEGLKFLFRAPFGLGRIVKRPVMPVHLAREYGARLSGMVADGDDGLDLLVQELGQ